MATAIPEQSPAEKPKNTPVNNNYSTTKKSVLHAKSFDKGKPCAEISFKEFLDFLRTAYQINEAIDGTSSELGNKKELDWKEVSANRLVNSLLEKSHECAQKTDTATLNDEEQNPSTSSHDPREGPKSSDKRMSNTQLGLDGPEVNRSVDQLMKQKLNELIQEGLLDSVLPYVVPKSPIIANTASKKSTPIPEGKKPGDKTPVSGTTFSLNTAKEKSSNLSKRKSSTGEIEVEIHVCDEVKNLKRDFRCPQKLLVSKMGYFAEVTTGQKLEDMDISVHCDVTIFDWLMRWVKSDENIEGNGPHLDATNVVPILVSAAFLQMDPLLQDCLVFCREHMNAIIQTSTNLSCLNDSILSRLSNLFSNSDVERLRDRKDKIVSRLFCRLISSLAENVPESARGHFASLASLYKCSQCGKLVVKHLAPKIPCQPGCMKMDRYGNVTSTHCRDLQWNLNDYIRSLRQECKSWRVVYWRLWGDCHFLFCMSCQNYFPMHQMLWCCYHPDMPQYFTKDHQRSVTFPIGRYPCCGERSYRFEPLSNKTGCQYKEHQPSETSEKEMAIYNLFTVHQSLIALAPPEIPNFPERITKLVSSKESGKEEVQEPLWWTGLELAPPLEHLGLLESWEAHKKRLAKPVPVPSLHGAPVIETCVRPMTAIGTRTFSRQRSVLESSEAANTSTEEDSSSDGSDVSEESSHATDGVKPKLRRASGANRYYSSAYTRPDGTGGCTWTPKLSIRMNQDNQRDNEQELVRQMCRLLCRRVSNESNNLTRTRTTRGYQNLYHRANHPGGTYVRVEQEWREECCPATCGARQRSVASKTTKYKTTAR